MSTQLSYQTNADPQNDETVQEFILARLSQMRKSQRWFASQLDITQTQINNWFRNKVPCSAQWIRDRAAKFASVLNCDESAILDRVAASVARQRASAEPQPLNKHMLRALAEDDDPTDELLDMLQRVQEIVGGAELPYEVCKQLIGLSKAG